MSHLPAILKANPGLLVAAVLVSIATLVLGILSLLMLRAGLSLRPVVFFLGFFGIILLPQLAGHLVLAVRPAPASSTPAAPSSPALEIAAGRFARPESLFPPDVTPDRIQDAKPIFMEALHAAQHAELALHLDGSTTLVAQFENYAQVRQASDTYCRLFQVENLAGDEPTGFRGTRKLTSDHVALLRTDRNLFIWTSRDPDALPRMRQSAAATIATLAPPNPNYVAAATAGRPVGPPLFPALQPLRQLFAPAPVKIASVTVLVLLASAWFFKASTWAAASRPAPGVSPVPETDLRQRLLAVHSLNTPIAVTESPDTRHITVTWKYADARWLDLARAHKLQRTHRLLLRLDPASHTVYCTEQSTSLDASAGLTDASFKWSTSMGITFFEYRHERVLGLQFDPTGRPTPNLSYTYTFDLQELKNPIISAITQSGWTWKPVVWDAPKPLRWLVD